MIHRYVRVIGNVVSKFHLVDENVITNDSGEIDELLGSKFLASLHGDVPENFIKCERDNDPRGKTIRVGYVYDRSVDRFTPMKPFDSWTFDENIWNWKAPIEMPSDGQAYYWDEESQSWQLAEISS